jgi:outer membrane murein-binding lipoprotein Lpp
LYNEEIKDLLSPTPNENLKIIEDPNIGPLIQNITEASFTSAADVKVLLEEGENRRHFGVTNMNAHSSRSHVIVRLHIESRKVPFKVTSALRTSWGKDKPHCVSTLNLVDLAGSERANKAGTSGQSLKEGSFINKSLLTLGTVISNLSEGKTQHIPYRNSKLTRLLATALGGNAKTSVVTCISPASGNVAESLNTLRFASRAKRIVNQVQKNEIMDMRSLTNKLTFQLQEIEHLRQQLELSKQLGFCPDDSEPGETLREKAVVTSKTLRGMKFLIKDGSRIMNGLRGQGMSHLAKKVQQEIKLAINGEREMSSVIDEFVTICETYLSKDRRLLEKIHNVSLQNEADSIMNIQGGMVVEDLGLLDEKEDDSPTLFDILISGGEELKETHETHAMAHEDFRVIACNRICRLEKEMIESSNREKQLRKSLDDSQHQLVEQHDIVRLLKTSEMTLHKQIEDLKVHRKQDSQSHTDQLKQLNARINEFQVKVEERDEKLNEKTKELMVKANEIERLRNQVEQLTKDLNAAIASKKAFEEESSRARSEMRIQMDKLRNNMHEMLLQGGMEAKVIESQNAELQKEVDGLRDEKEFLSKTKENLELELQKLQAALGASRDSEKSRQSEITALRNEVST